MNPQLACYIATVCIPCNSLLYNPPMGLPFPRAWPLMMAVFHPNVYVFLAAVFFATRCAAVPRLEPVCAVQLHVTFPEAPAEPRTVRRTVRPFSAVAQHA